jgi:hypothetical protein
VYGLGMGVCEIIWLLGYFLGDLERGLGGLGVFVGVFVSSIWMCERADGSFICAVLWSVGCLRTGSLVG